MSANRALSVNIDQIVNFKLRRVEMYGCPQK